MSDGPQQFLTHKYRLLPTRKQHVALGRILEDQRQLYNAALQERIDCYAKTGRGRSYFDQCKALTEWRQDDDGATETPLNIQRWTVKRVDNAYGGFFRRIKAGNGKAGFPRYRSFGRWNAFGFKEMQGLRFDGARIRWSGLPGGLRVHMHRPLPDGAAIKSCVFRRDEKGWFVCFAVAIAAPEKRTVESAVGLDLGLNVFAYQSDGVVIPSPRTARRAEKMLRRRQRALSRCKRDSQRRKKVKREVTRLHAKIVNTRTTWLHQQSARIANSYDLIAVEDLRVKNMVKNPYLARSIHDASWSKFLEFLSYKAEKAGSTVVRVNPRNTSQACSGCGELVPKSLAVREHSCPHCGLVIDRDWNAAKNILAAVVSGGAGNVGECAMRRPGKLMEIVK